MKILQSIFLLLMLTGCFSHRELMTRDGYVNLEIGTSLKKVEKTYGKPYSIYSKEEGRATYEYIEKIMMGNQIVEQRRYYIVIEDGRVIGKYMKISNPPPFEAIYSDDPYPNY